MKYLIVIVLIHHVGFTSKAITEYKRPKSQSKFNVTRKEIRKVRLSVCEPEGEYQATQTSTKGLGGRSPV